MLPPLIDPYSQSLEPLIDHASYDVQVFWALHWYPPVANNASQHASVAASA